MCKTDYGGGGGKNVPKIDYVICEQPLIISWLILGVIIIDIIPRKCSFEDVSEL